MNKIKIDDTKIENKEDFDTDLDTLPADEEDVEKYGRGEPEGMDAETMEQMFGDITEPGKLSRADVELLAPKGSWLREATSYLARYKHFSLEESCLVAHATAMIAASRKYFIRTDLGEVMPNAMIMMMGETSSGKDLAMSAMCGMLPDISFKQYKESKKKVGGQTVTTIDTDVYTKSCYMSSETSKAALMESLWQQRCGVVRISEYSRQMESQSGDMDCLDSVALELYGFFSTYIRSYKNLSEMMRKHPLHAPSLSIIAGIQPNVFNGKKNVREKFDLGMMSRYQFIRMNKKELRSHQSQGIDYRVREKALRDRLAGIVGTEMLDYTHSSEMPPYLVEIPITPEAYEVQLEYRLMVERELRSKGLQRCIPLVQKYCNESHYKWAIGLVVGRSDGIQPLVIDREIMRLATKIGNYHIRNLLYVHGDVQQASSGIHPNILLALTKLGNEPSSPYNIRRAHRKLGDAYTTAEVLLACRDLVKKGILYETDKRFYAI